MSNPGRCGVCGAQRRPRSITSRGLGVVLRAGTTAACRLASVGGLPRQGARRLLHQDHNKRESTNGFPFRLFQPGCRHPALIVALAGDVGGPPAGALLALDLAGIGQCLQCHLRLARRAISQLADVVGRIGGSAILLQEREHLLCRWTQLNIRHRCTPFLVPSTTRRIWVTPCGASIACPAHVPCAPPAQ